jgi:hypothetical protein
MKNNRPEILEKAPLQYAPENELGVVFLFSHIAKKLRIRIESIRPQFPDCIAYQKTVRGEKRLRIEFEFRSSSFKNHNHSSKDCDWIVCWEHDWPGVPENIKVVELKKYFGVGFNVWIQPVVGKEQQAWLSGINQANWGLSKRTSKDDLLLMYHAVPEKAIKDVFILNGDLSVGEAGWREGNCYLGPIKRVCKLGSPIFLEDLQQHRIIKTSSFVRRNMQGNLNATEYWPYLFEMIIQRNPSAKKKLLKYSPDRI